MDQYQMFDHYYKDIFGTTFGIRHKPKGSDTEKYKIRAYMSKAKMQGDRGLASVMLDMAYELKEQCGDIEFHKEIADDFNKF